MRAAIYARKSLDENDGARSTIESQLEELYKFADENNITIVREYIDNGVRGWRVSRDALDALMYDIRQVRRGATPPFDMILVAEWDRFFRDFANAKIIINEIEARGYITGSARGGIVYSKTERLGRDLMLFVSELDNELRRGHTTAGQIHWASLGYSPGGKPPFGYRRQIVEDERGRPRIKYKICEPETEAVRMIFRDYAAGLTITQIIEHLEATNSMPPQAKTWNVHSVWRILFGPNHQRKYLGYMVFNIKKHNKKYQIWKYNDKKEWVIVPNAHPPIITIEMQRAVNARYAKKDRSHYRPDTPLELLPGGDI